MLKKFIPQKFTVKMLCQLALLIALEIVLNRFLSIRTPIVKIGFSFVPIIVCAIAFGPVWAASVYVVADLLGTFIEGNIPIVGLTVSYLFVGLVYGLFLYKQDSQSFKNNVSIFVKIIISAAIHQFFFGLVVNTYWLWIAGYASGGTYWATMFTRAWQCIGMFVVIIVLTPFLLKLVSILRKAKLV